VFVGMVDGRKQKVSEDIYKVLEELAMRQSIVIGGGYGAQ